MLLPLLQMAAAFGPEALARHRAARAAAKAAAELPLPTTKSGRLKSSVRGCGLVHCLAGPRALLPAAAAPLHTRTCVHAQQMHTALHATQPQLAADTSPADASHARPRLTPHAALPHAACSRLLNAATVMQAKAALLAHISVHGMLGLPHEHVRAALDLPPSSSLANPARDAQLAQATPAYDASQALAYALVRLPGCYAAAQRVFRELERRLPDFQPRSLLDFGAGPGTASWAAQEVRLCLLCTHDLCVCVCVCTSIHLTGCRRPAGRAAVQLPGPATAAANSGCLPACLPAGVGQQPDVADGSGAERLNAPTRQQAGGGPPLCSPAPAPGEQQRDELVTPRWWHVAICATS